MNQVIVLNNGYQPLNIVSAKKAIKMLIKDKVEVLSSYDDKVFSTWQCAINAPIIVKMKYFVNTTNKMRKNVPLTRRNIYERDNGKCQYCGKDISISQLTFDHVMPRSRGGLTTWENIVASCKDCNTRKGNKLPNECGMILKTRPIRPNVPMIDQVSLMRDISNMVKNLPKSMWVDHIYWNVELEK